MQDPPPNTTTTPQPLSQASAAITSNGHITRPARIGGPKSFWSEWSACATLGCWQKRREPLFLVIKSSFSYYVGT